MQDKFKNYFFHGCKMQLNKFERVIFGHKFYFDAMFFLKILYSIYKKNVPKNDRIYNVNLSLKKSFLNF